MNSGLARRTTRSRSRRRKTSRKWRLRRETCKGRFAFLRGSSSPGGRTRREVAAAYAPKQPWRAQRISPEASRNAACAAQRGKRKRAGRPKPRKQSEKWLRETLAGARRRTLQDSGMQLSLLPILRRIGQIPPLSLLLFTGAAACPEGRGGGGAFFAGCGLPNGQGEVCVRMPAIRGG